MQVDLKMKLQVLYVIEYNLMQEEGEGEGQGEEL
jgi:hypothetical protein